MCILDSLVFAKTIGEGNFDYLCNRFNFKNKETFKLSLDFIKEKYPQFFDKKQSDEFNQLLKILIDIDQIYQNKEFNNHYVEINLKHLLILEECSDLLGRTLMGQLDVLANYLDYANSDTQEFLNLRERIEVCKVFIDDLPKNSFYGVNSINFSIVGKIAFEINGILRYRRSYDQNPNITPENRWETGGYGVNFDEPSNYSGLSFIGIEKI